MALVLSAYDQVCQAAREIVLVNGASHVLGWDQETYMPPKGIQHRSRILAHLTGLAHERLTSKRFIRLLQDAEDELRNAEEHSVARSNVKWWRWKVERSLKVPKRLVEQLSSAVSLGQAAWAKARQDSDFASFAPHLQRLVELSREMAGRIHSGPEPYDALLDEHERGMSAHSVESLFRSIRPALVKIGKAAVERSAEEAPPHKAMLGHCPIAKQQILNREVAEAMGFDFEAGRIDTTAHPFCSGFGPGDVRLTTRYDERDFLSSLFGVLHEAGHGMYEQGLLEEEWGLPSGTAVSLGIHESQSRLWENHVGRSKTFWQHWYPRAQSLFPHLKKLTLDQFMLGVNRAKFSFIRVEADEATYDLHIMLRFSIERQLFNDSLKVKDVPDAWNAEFESSFGMTPPDAAHGCLQDIHWSMGGFGYFPTYTLGNLNAAQLYKAALRHAGIRKAIAKADYSPLLQWLRTHVHQPGSVLSPLELMSAATGKTTAASAYLAHLRSRFL